MLGIRFIKVQPTTHLFQFQDGKVRREGLGLSFFYYGPTTSLVAVSMASEEVPFIFEEVTADHQTITMQGQVTYRVADPKKLVALMNFTLAPRGEGYASDDPRKLPQRIINAVQVLARGEIQRLKLRDAILASDRLVAAVRAGLGTAGEITQLGLEVLGLSVLAIKPTPETARALEAETREQLLREADEAIYSRRNAAIEQERAIKESELNTEIAVELKRRQIRETQMDAERAVQAKRHEIENEDLGAKIAIEERRRGLVELASANARTEADARAYAVRGTLEAIQAADPQRLQALTQAGMSPEQLVAAAFQEIAGRADKIGQLNISPDLLRELLTKS